MANGFKDSTKMVSGHSFPSSAGFTGSSGQVSSVRSYTRKAPSPRERAQDAMGSLPQELSSMKSSMDAVSDRLPKRYAEGGSVGNSATLRRDPVTEFDKDYGGKTPLRPGFKKGGQWISKATKNKGALHRALKVPEGQKIPASKLEKAENSKNPLMRKRAALAETLSSFHKAKGGKVKHDDAEADLAMMKKEIPKMVKPTALKGRGFQSTPLIGK